MNGRLLLACGLSFLPSLLLARPAATPRDLQRAPGLEHASISISVKRVDDGRVVHEYNPRLSLRPASVMKLLPAFLALEKEGAAFTYRTTLSHSGTIRDGVLHGQLVITAGGDPALGSACFPGDSFPRQVVEATRRAGIKRLLSPPVVEERGDPPRVPGSWPWEDVSNYYGALYHPFNYRDNTYTITLAAGQPGEPARILAVDPPTMELALDNRAITDPAGRNDVWIYGGPLASRLLLAGSVTGDPPCYPVKGAMHAPSRAFARELTALLEEEGIAVGRDGLPGDLPAPGEERRVLLTVESPPLEEIVYQTNRKSVNLFAEALGALVDPAAFGRAAKERLGSAGIDTSGVIIEDACGLSPANAAPAGFFTDFLAWAYPRSPAFLASLPEGMVDASLAVYAAHPSLGPHLRAKTGSMTRVRALAGYLFSPRDGWLAFTIIVNNYTCTPRQLQELLRDFLASFSRP
ncbi:MAG: D-alanyl-D-alanine carboxypeptidase/D-alanyl-D-alanine-endopeptidase [Odoribacteraceae bacterium]|jgi:D-alanyl-D-alanine carboxypeptidase/D-alanyl-D-alanine-endopeptidase (penicillin-binding protein 4)|nr:D-alanyl-D-alanine carboxypeptidase/D-alanyl-D-alanine-endopeptidase [Odoribacteraceae bacterium]